MDLLYTFFICFIGYQIVTTIIEMAAVFIKYIRLKVHLQGYHYLLKTFLYPTLIATPFIITFIIAPVLLQGMQNSLESLEATFNNMNNTNP